MTPGEVGLSETDCHRRSAQRRVRELADQIRRLRKRGLEQRPLLLRYRRRRRRTFSVGGGYMIAAGDENNVISLYKERESDLPLKTWDFDSQLPYGSESINIHGVGAGGNTAYFVGGFDNTNKGEPEPSRNTMFAVRITGSGASTELSYLGSYIGLREDLIEWDKNNGSPLGLPESAASGMKGESPEGFKIEGVEFLPGSTRKRTSPSGPRSSRREKIQRRRPHQGAGDSGHQLLLAVQRQPGEHPRDLRHAAGVEHAGHRSRSGRSDRAQHPLDPRECGRRIPDHRRDRELGRQPLPGVGLGRRTRRRTGAAEQRGTGRRRKACGARSPRRPNRSATAAKPNCCRTTARRSGTAKAPKTPNRASTRACRRASDGW